MSGIADVMHWLRPRVPVQQEFSRLEHAQLEPLLLMLGRVDKQQPSVGPSKRSEALKNGAFRLNRSLFGSFVNNVYLLLFV